MEEKEKSFSEALRDALDLADVRINEAASEAKVKPLLVSRTINGKSRPRKKAAQSLTIVGINALNKRIRGKNDEVKKLREAGTELRQAYVREYEQTKND